MADEITAHADAIRRIYRAAELAYREATLLVDANLAIVESHKFGRFLGVADADLIGQDLVPDGWTFVDDHGGVLDPAEHPAARALRTASREEAIVHLRPAAGEVVRLRMHARLVVDESGTRVDLSIEERERRAEAREHVEAAERRFQTLAELLPVAVYEATARGEVTYVNAAFTRLTGYGSADDVPDLPMLEIVHPDDLDDVMEAAGSVAESGEYRARYRVRHLDGSSRWVTSRIELLLDDTGSVSGFVGAIEDVDDLQRAEQEARRRQAELAHEARHDPLTGLANREVLEERRARDSAAERAALVFYADIDRFKAVNDAYGHGPGDRVLIEVGRRIARVVRDDDVVVRIGGDEFVGWCEAPSEESAAEQLVQRVGAVVAAEPVVLDDGRELEVTISIGAVVVSPERLGEAVSLADVALYRAKRAGRDRWVVGDGAPVTNEHAFPPVPDRRGDGSKP